eukprot:TRINITY_DN2989_c0_g1_i1.p7 TRINITY_DN2989_c0_g1~~TRINITY_DN2989_c0_g1_i1.p7  ORF type:complete len:109 (+),score=38.46 TRINITY_DN2989_c0_g1_i1:34-327(+)
MQAAIQQAQEGGDQAELMRMLEESQIKDTLRMYNNLVQKCFGDCVNNFRFKKLDEKEELCVYRCTEKYLKYQGRVARAFGEKTMQQQEEHARQFADA